MDVILGNETKAPGTASFLGWGWIPYAVGGNYGAVTWRMGSQDLVIRG